MKQLLLAVIFLLTTTICYADEIEGQLPQPIEQPVITHYGITNVMFEIKFGYQSDGEFVEVTKKTYIIDSENYPAFLQSLNITEEQLKNAILNIM